MVNDFERVEGLLQDDQVFPELFCLWVGGISAVLINDDFKKSNSQRSALPMQAGGQRSALNAHDHRTGFVII